MLLRARSLFVAATVVAVACGLVLGLPSVALAKKTLGLSAASFEFNVGAGQSGQGELIVLNSGDEPIRVMVYAANQRVDKKGQAVFKVPDRDDRDFLNSPATWMRLHMPEDAKSFGNTPYLELKPGDRIPVRFTFETPENAVPGDHPVVLFFEMFDFVKNKDGAVSQVSGRLGTRVRIRVRGQFVEQLDVRPFGVQGFALGSTSIILGDKVPWVFTARNEGNIDKIVNADVVVLDGNENQVAASRVMTETTLYAGTVSEAQGALKPPASFGRYAIKATLSYKKEGADPNAPEVKIEKVRTFWLLPAWLPIALGAVLGLIALWLMWRSSVRKFAKKLAEKQQTAADTPPVAPSEAPAPPAAAAPATPDLHVVKDDQTGAAE